jgi:Domain of unknown function (DUF4158)
VARLSERLGIPVNALRGYGVREQTRTDHLREVTRYLGWRTMDELAWKQLQEFLFARAMEHDAPRLLFRLACEYLASARRIRPGLVNLLERIATAREQARAETWARVAHLLDDARRAELDELLVVDPLLGRTRLAWLGIGPTQATPGAVKDELDKLAYLRRLDAHTLDLSALPAERRRFLAGVGRRLTAQALQRREGVRRYPILLTLLAQSAVDVLDGALLLFDQALSGRESAAKAKLTQGPGRAGPWRGGPPGAAGRDPPDRAGPPGRRRAGGVGCCARAWAWTGCARRGRPPQAAAPRPRAPGDAGCLHGLCAPVRARCAARDPLRRRDRHQRAAAGRPGPGGAVCDRGVQGAAAAEALALADEELHAALADLDGLLATAKDSAKDTPGEVRLGDDGELIIPPLTAEDRLPLTQEFGPGTPVQLRRAAVPDQGPLDHRPGRCRATSPAARGSRPTPTSPTSTPPTTPR